MKIKTLSMLVSILALSASAVASAAPGLTINAAEFGVGKFHRYDNGVHPYDHASAWFDYILPNDAATDQPLILDNADGSVTIFFSTLDELIASVVKASQDRNTQVSVLNVHGHGLPGAMWFPKDDDTRQSFDCGQWRSAATGSDQGNYDQYYSAVSKEDIMSIREMSNSSGSSMSCTTGLTEWKDAVAKNSSFKPSLAANAQIHFLSCVVGLGTAGAEFTQGIASLLLKPQGRVESSMNFGLGDWSMPEGMGFWDYVSDDQIARDNQNYVTDHKDRELAQKGTIRMVTQVSGAWTSTLLSNRDFLPLTFELSVMGTPVPETFTVESFFAENATRVSPTRVRVPGTNAYVTMRSVR